jgi:hypothetical protein
MRGLMRVLAVAAMLAVPATISAQFGHPLKGQWSGGYGKSQENRLLMNFDWDGKEISGVINPGPNAITVKKADIDYSDATAWRVKLQGEGKDATGKAVAVMIDGTLENIGAYYRIFRGTWTQGSVKSDFAVTRN